jgi:hypothetical protein
MLAATVDIEVCSVNPMYLARDSGIFVSLQTPFPWPQQEKHYSGLVDGFFFTH